MMKDGITSSNKSKISLKLKIGKLSKKQNSTDRNHNNIGKANKKKYKKKIPL